MKAILDTGPWVALIDRSESRHTHCVEWLKNFSGSLYSTEAVLTEVLYLLNFSIIAQGAALDFVLKSLIEIVPSNTQSLRKTKNLCLVTGRCGKHCGHISCGSCWHLSRFTGALAPIWYWAIRSNLPRTLATAAPSRHLSLPSSAFPPQLDNYLRAYPTG